jgi:hypothetical protein
MNSAVYQPTTVTFENNSGPIFPHQTTTTSRLKAAFRKKWMQIILLIGSLFFISLGLIVMITSSVDFEDAIANEDNVTEISVHEKEFDIVLMILGAFFTIFGIVLLGESDTKAICTSMSHVLNVNFLFCSNLYKSRRLLASKLCRVPMLISKEATRSSAPGQWWANNGSQSSLNGSTSLHSICAHLGTSKIRRRRGEKEAHARWVKLMLIIN